MEQKMYYERPTQVVFADPDEPGAWITGIAYRDEIICACCGGVFEVEEVLEFALEEQPAIYEYSTWNDLSDEIYGGEYPDGYQPQDNEG